MTVHRVPHSIPYQLGAFSDKVPDDSVLTQVTACICVVGGSQLHLLTLVHIHTGLGHLDLGPNVWMEEGERGREEKGKLLFRPFCKTDQFLILLMKR